MGHCVNGTDGQYVLFGAPSVVCMEGGHRSLVFALIILMPIYMIGLMPYALVAGDATYVQQIELFSLEAWDHNAFRKATALHQGPWHPNPDHVSMVLGTELMGKAILPLVTVLTETRPILQMVLNTMVGAALCLTAFAFPMGCHYVYSLVRQGLRLLILCAMICGLVASFVNDVDNHWPELLLGVSVVFVLLLTFVRYWFISQQKQKSSYRPTITYPETNEDIVEEAPETNEDTVEEAVEEAVEEEVEE